jgi:hypothetical protein
MEMQKNFFGLSIHIKVIGSDIIACDTKSSLCLFLIRMKSVGQGKLSCACQLVLLMIGDF